jgi:hypothetical protein
LPNPEEGGKPFCIGQEPRLDLVYYDAEAHVRAWRRQPIDDHGRRTSEILVEVHEDQPCTPPRSRVVARQSATQIGFPILDLHAMHDSTTGLDDASQYGFVGRSLHGTGDVDQRLHSISEER